MRNTVRHEHSQGHAADWTCIPGVDYSWTGEFPASSAARQRRPPAPGSPSPSTPRVGKGRPTPKRRDAEGRRGPVAPPPKTQREAVKRSKDRRQVAVQGRAPRPGHRAPRADDARRRRLRAAPGQGQGAGLRPRPGRRRGATWPDCCCRWPCCRFVILLLPVPIVQAYGPLVLMIAIIAAVIDTVVFGRQLARAVRDEVPRRATGRGCRPRARRWASTPSTGPA